jgi:hypothetical protein
MMVYLTDVKVAHFSFLPFFCANKKGSSRHPHAKIIFSHCFFIGSHSLGEQRITFRGKICDFYVNFVAFRKKNEV